MSARSGDGAGLPDRRESGPALELADFKRAFKRFRSDQVTDNAASLTYYSLLSLFPALLFCAAILGVWTLVVAALALVTFVLVFLGGGLASDVLGKIGLGDTTAAIWRLARWPAALVVTMTIYAIVYYAAPNVEVRRFRWITPGAVVGVALWILASIAFFVYVSNFSSYGATYGAFAGAVILLVWLWLTNVAFLFGAELNAVVDLRRARHLPLDYDGPVLPAKEPANG